MLVTEKSRSALIFAMGLVAYEDDPDKIELFRSDRSSPWSSLTRLLVKEPAITPSGDCLQST